MASNEVAALRELAANLTQLLLEEKSSREIEYRELAVALDAIWVFACGIEVIMMQVGFAMLEAGFVRERNVVATYLKNVLDFLLNILVGTLFSFNLAYPDVPELILTLPVSGSYDLIRQRFFNHILFQGAAATICSGSMAERITVQAYVGYSMFLSGIVFPLGVRITWGGGFLTSWLDEPYVDFAGSGVVHLVGGIAALVGCITLGPRNGRFDAERVKEFQPHDLGLVVTGAMLLWVGWYGFNCGSTGSLSDAEDVNRVSRAFVSTTLGAAAGGASVAAVSMIQTRGVSIDVLGIVNGVLAGLVSITASCDAVSLPSAIIIGMLSAPFVLLASKLLHRRGVDDVCDAIGVHGVSGCWGVLAVGLFHEEKGLLTEGSTELLRSQVIGAAVLASWSAVASFTFLRLLGYFVRLRPDLLEETAGLDERLGFHAYVRVAEDAKAHQDVMNVLEAFNHKPSQACEALRSLAQVPLLTLSPQASDGILQGEIEDILAALSSDSADSSFWEFFAFLSHHKKDGGEVARVLLDALRHTLESRQGREGFEWCEKVTQRFDRHKLAFLDSNNLRDLSSLLGKVEKSMNIVLLLTRSVLRRPWCIAEITRAYCSNCKIICVIVQWPDKENDPRAFRMPQDLNAAIAFVSNDTQSLTSSTRQSGRNSPGSRRPRAGSLSGLPATVAGAFHRMTTPSSRSNEEEHESMQDIQLSESIPEDAGSEDDRVRLDFGSPDWQYVHV